MLPPMCAGGGLMPSAEEEESLPAPPNEAAEAGNGGEESGEEVEPLLRSWNKVERQWRQNLTFYLLKYSSYFDIKCVGLYWKT